jgi:DNA replication protein DnaC
MELYPRYFTALGNGRQADMERLNDIFKKDAQPAQRRRSQSDERARPPVNHQAFYERTARSQAGGRPGPYTYQGDAYQPAAGADVGRAWSGEWDEEETGTIRYGDWESDIYDIPARQQEQASQPPIGRGASRIAQAYAQGSRSFITRELRRPVDEEAVPSPAQYSPSTRQPMPAQPAQHYPPPGTSLAPAQISAQSMARTQRVTQPLKRSSKIEPQTPQPIPAPYTNPKATCPICKGKGYLRADVPFGHPNFGKPIACECKEKERRERRRLQLQEMSNLGELRDKRFDNFNVSRAVSEAYQIAREYAEEPEGWLVFIGRVGCGKTHLAAAIANQALANGSRVLFSTVSDLLDHLRATFMPNATEFYDHLFQEMREAELLVLDDLGAQQSSPWANEKLFQLLNYRYNSCFPTIITTNNTGLQGIEERIRSRIMDVSLVTRITLDQTGDYRLRNPRRD